MFVSVSRGKFYTLTRVQFILGIAKQNNKKTLHKTNSNSTVCCKEYKKTEMTMNTELQENENISFFTFGVSRE